MSKRTTDSSKPASDAPKTRSRAAAPKAAETTPAAPKAPRTRRKATPAASAAVAADAAVAPAIVETPEPVVVVEQTEIVVATRNPSHDEIALRAYFISLEQGADPVAAWLRAERELTTV